MPIPFLFIGIGAAGAALGIGKGVKAGVDNSEAKNVNGRANSTIEKAKETLERSRAASGSALEKLGGKKIEILDGGINRFVATFERLHNVDLSQSPGLEELGKFRIDKQSFSELKEMGNFATSIAGGIATGGLGGALTAFGAYGAATAFATASTGTAIATLSGAAATNATLAFFGGGALAAGGLGMAGGAAVLGGLVAGPALAIMGFVMGAKASKNLDNAYSNLAQAKKIAEELSTAAAMCNGIRRRSYMFYRMLIKCEAVFMPLVFELEKIVEQIGTDYSAFSDDQRRVVAMSASMAGTIKSILDTPILTENGKLTKESELKAREINLIDFNAVTAIEKKDYAQTGSPDEMQNGTHIVCSSCGARLKEGQKFCTECGVKVEL